MSILRGRKSVPGIIAVKRVKWKEKTTRSSHMAPLPPCEQRNPFLRMKMEHRDDASGVVFTILVRWSQETIELEAIYSGHWTLYRGGDGVPLLGTRVRVRGWSLGRGIYMIIGGVFLLMDISWDLPLPTLRLEIRLDVGSVNVPYLLARYLRRFVAGRKSEAQISGGQFVARLAKLFGLLTAEVLRGLTVIAPELSIIDMGELVRLIICEQLDGTWAWVALGLERQPDAADGAPEAVEDAPVDDQEVQGFHRDVRSLRGLVERSMTDQGRFSTWMISCMVQLMDASGLTYQAFLRELTYGIPEMHEDW
nr:hypothetical protein [Tanacetum cinerariifolium]